MNSRELQVPRISSCDEEMRKATGIGAEQKWKLGGWSNPFVACRNSNGEKSRVESDARRVGVHSRIGRVAETLWQGDWRRVGLGGFRERDRPGGGEGVQSPNCRAERLLGGRQSKTARVCRA